jgi:hypothetical protein
MKKNSGKAPSYQMYPKDWNEDAALKMCSLAAQGLWIRLINTSYDMPVKGVFRFNKEPLKAQEILIMLPGNMRSKKNAFSELIKWGVIKQMDDNSFYCKRLYKDMRLREIRKEAGSKGGNPNLVGNLVKQNLNQTPKQNLTPAASASSSSSTSVYNIYTIKQVQDAAYPVGVSDKQAQEFFDHYDSQGWVKGNGQKITNLRSALSSWKNKSYQFEAKNGTKKQNIKDANYIR